MEIFKKKYLVAELARVFLFGDVIDFLQISIFLGAKLMRDLYGFQPLASWISLYFKKNYKTANS